MSKLEELRSHFSGTEKISYTQADRKFVFSFLEVAKIEEVEILIHDTAKDASKLFWIKFKDADIYAFIARDLNSKDVRFIDIAFSGYSMRIKEFTSEEAYILENIIMEALGGNVKDDFEQTFRKYAKIEF